MDKTDIRTAIIACAFAVVFPTSINSQNPGPLQTESPQMYFERTTKEEWMEHATAAVLAVTAAGDTVACSESMKMLLPASTMKAITTGAALHSLGEDYRFETRLGYSGRISGGTLYGDLYIIGGGDPVLGSRNHIAEPVERTFGKWKAMLAEAGISRIDGRIIGDDRFFDRVAEADSWQWNDIGTYYGAGTSGLSFNENMQNINVTPGDAPGKPLKISIGYPALPWMEYRFQCTTGKAGTGNSLYMFTSPFAPTGEMRGTFAIDRKTKTEQVANKFPAYTCAWHFMKYLAGCGISCSKGAADLGTVFGIPENERIPEDSIRVIGSTFSPELAEIVSETNHESNNVYAETLFRTLGKEYCGSGCYDSSYVAVRGLLEETGVTGHKTIIRDGSGLSRENLLSADFLCDLLMKMTLSPSFEDFFNSLPRPGGIGTLEYEMQSVPFSIKDRIRMKSGSMGGVRCLSGYIIPETGAREDMIIFSLLVNGYTVPLYRIQRALDSIILSLAAYCPQP